MKKITYGFLLNNQIQFQELEIDFKNKESFIKSYCNLCEINNEIILPGSIKDINNVYLRLLFKKTYVFRNSHNGMVIAFGYKKEDISANILASK